MQRSITTLRPIRLAALAAAGLLVLGACGSDDAATEGTAPPSTEVPDDDPGSTPVTTPVTDPEPSLPPPATGVRPVETITAVIEGADGPRLCWTVLESMPPQCGDGVELDGWSWDAIDVERVDADTTWVDQIYVSGAYDPAAGTFTVDGARLPTDADRERIRPSRFPDDSLPCEEPAGGWPERTQEWPADEIAQLDGYAGSWSDPSGQVVVVKFTGDLEAAEAEIRGRFDEGLCVVAAERSLAELEAVEAQLAERDDLDLVSTAIVVDGSGEWVDAVVVTADATVEAALSAELGTGVVRLQPLLRPTAG